MCMNVRIIISLEIYRKIPTECYAKQQICVKIFIHFKGNGRSVKNTSNKEECSIFLTECKSAISKIGLENTTNSYLAVGIHNTY